MARRITHPSVLASAAAGSTLAVLSTQRSLPAWLWLVWLFLTTVAMLQAVRSDR